MPKVSMLTLSHDHLDRDSHAALLKEGLDGAMRLRVMVQAPTVKPGPRDIVVWKPGPGDPEPDRARIPMALKDCMDYAAKMGCDAICFTDRAEPIGPLPVYAEVGKRVLLEMT